MPSYNRQLVHEIINRIEEILVDAESHARPLEMSPYREQLFDLFSTSWSNQLTEEEQGPLAADAICKELGGRWGLTQTAQSSVAENTSLPREHIAKMRSLWSVMRLWMEWNYAWNRFREFHPAT